VELGTGVSVGASVGVSVGASVGVGVGVSVDVAVDAAPLELELALALPVALEPDATALEALPMEADDAPPLALALLEPTSADEEPESQKAQLAARNAEQRRAVRIAAEIPPKTETAYTWRAQV
ncbi:hypothetical protein BBJ28_00026810, partial [Nothophytophthora sp. Chile5]